MLILIPSKSFRTSQNNRDIFFFLSPFFLFPLTSLILAGNTDLPSYKELFPSHPDISNMEDDPSSTLPPPSYDDFVKTLSSNRPTTTTLPLTSLRSHGFSLPTTNQSQTSPARCIWITDRTRRPVCIRGTVTYV